MKVEVRTAKRLGLEIYQVFVCGTFLAEFLCRELANTKALQFANYLNRKAA